ncbi:MAG: S9 family peptidase [Alphaproteobacteria bacterium]|nr:S9 family peptidase [Alphaproteobacteria bacterium]MBU2271141.1 S9 family peptidase [Alphaproteobacteria bacterium]MBU2418716.1 S9 family peptidase [Alphaproteobacteria bacterium]
MLRSVVCAGLKAVVLAAALIGVGGLPAVAQVRVEPAPLTAYGSLPSFEMVTMSPSGERLAFITVAGEDRTLVIVDMATKEQLGGAAVGQVKVRNLDWVDEDRVLVTSSTSQAFPNIGIVEQELSTAQIYDIAQRKIIVVFNGTRGVLPFLFSNVRIVDRADGPLVLVRGYAFGNAGRLDLFNIDPATGRGRLEEVMGTRVNGFVLDASGQSVARSEYDPASRVWSLYLKSGSGFRKAWDTVAPLDAPYLVGLGMQGDSVIVGAKRPDLSQPGREDAEYFDVNIETGAWRPVRFDFRPDGLLFHPVTRRMVGARRSTNQGTVYAMADPAANALWSRIEQTFDGRAPNLVGWSNDLQKAVVYTGSDRDPGTYYALDFAAGSLMKVGGAYEGVRPEQVASVRAVEYAAADGLTIQGYLTLPPGIEDPRGLPLVVMPHGGPASHDVRTFDYWAQAIASRGYAVLQPNFRGSTDRGDAFMEAGYGEWGLKMQTDLSDGVRYLAAEGVIDPSRVCIVGASYGGYAALAGVTLDPGVYRCAVSYAGVSDLRRMMTDIARDTGRNDNATLRYWSRFMGADGAGDRSLDQRSPAYLAERADAPILLMHGRDDHVVPIVQSRVMADALRRAGKPHQFIELDGEDHWLSRADSRQRMLNETVRFLERHNPPN